MADNQEISRLKENERDFFERPKRKDNSRDIMKERNKRKKLQEKIHVPVSGNIKIYVPVTMKRLLFSINWTRQNYVWMKRSVVLAIIQC